MKGDAMTTEDTETRNERRRRVTAGAWGLLLAWTGAVLLIPGEHEVLWNVWLVGVGTVLLGASVVALALRLRPTGITIIVGALGLLCGIGGLTGVPIPALGIVLIGWGLVTVLATARQHAAT